MEIKEGDVILSKVIFTDPSEVKKRPVIVIRRLSASDFMALPITSSETRSPYIEIDNSAFQEGSIPKPSKILVTKPYILEKELYVKHYGRVKREFLDIVMRSFIKENVGVYYRLFHSEKVFVPGETRINYAGRVYDEREMMSLVDSALDFWLTAGRFEREFTKKLAEFLGVKYVITTNSGSSANLLAISTLTSYKLGDKRLKPGDEVVTVAAGFPTTVAPIVQNGLVPVFVDIELGTYNIDVDQLEDAISEKTKAVFLAHTLGVPFDLDRVMEIAQKYDLWVVEDNCDAFGAKWDGRYTGTFGHLSSLSFYPAHHITMGEGGAVITNDTQLKRIVTSFRDWGRDCWCEPGHDNTCGKRFGWQLGTLPFGYDHKYIYSHLGYNLKITDMQAAVGVAQLDKLPEFIRKRQENWKRLYEGLKEFEEFFILPEVPEKAEVSPFGFVLTIRDDAPFDRKEITGFLEGRKIQTRTVFAGNIVRQPAFTESKVPYRVVGELKNTDKVMLYGLFIVTTLCYVTAMYIADLYNLSYRFKTTLYVARFVTAVCIGTGLTFPLLYMLRIKGYAPCVWLEHLVLILTVGYLWRLVFEWIFRYKKKPLNVLLIGEDDFPNKLYELMQTSGDYSVNIVDDLAIGCYVNHLLG